MKVHIVIPYSLEKNLGKAYNEAMALIPDGDWACIMDYDVQLLTPDAGRILHEYAVQYPTAALMSCYTNRIHPSSSQLLTGAVDTNTDMLYHIKKAEEAKSNLYQVKGINQHLSGFLMLLSKEQWRRYPFVENGGCLGVDTDYMARMNAANKSVLLMKGLYVYHGYRLLNGIKDKSHLL